MINKLVIKNLATNIKHIGTFILVNAIIFSVIFVFFSLTKNEYVLNRNENLVILMNMGAVISSAIAIVFTLYSQRFIFKRRYRELSLYLVLGLEKKHIMQMLVKESLVTFIITSVLTIFTGYVFGILSFLSLKRILNFTIDSFDAFKFESSACITTLLIMAAGFMLNIAINIVNVARKSPNELIRYEKAAEKEPKVKFITLILGLILLASGYFIALTIENPLEAIQMLFIAIIIVIIATYLLFTSLSIFVLKLKRKNKNYYYKKENFLSISNLLYRMKSNGISLATISVLCAGVIIAISVTYTIGQEFVKLKLDGDYELSCVMGKEYLDKTKLENEIKRLDVQLDDSIQRKYFINFMSAVGVTDDKSIEFGEKEWQNQFYMTLTTKEFYEKAFSKTLEPLGENEVYFTSSESKFSNFKTINIDGKKYTTKYVEDKSAKNLIAAKIFVVVNDYDTFINIIKKVDEKNHQFSESGVLVKIFANEKGKDMSKELSKFASRNHFSYRSQKEFSEAVQVFSGGFLFLGILISIVMTIITGLIIYYKQLSEADEDKKNYVILKKLGISSEMASKTIKRQMRSVFMLPIVVAVIHNLVASKMVATMLKLFAVSSYFIYLKNLIFLSLIFAVIYMIMYMIAKRAYQKVVWAGNGNN